MQWLLKNLITPRFQKLDAVAFEYARVDAFDIAINKDVQALSDEFQ